MHQKYLQISIPVFPVTEDPPLIRSIATSYASILMDRLHELRFPFWHDSIFDCNQHRPILNVKFILADNNRHTPVVPWTQIRSRIWKPGEGHEDRSCDGSNPCGDKGNPDACALRYAAPCGAPKSETPLINQDEDCKDSRPYPIRSHVLNQRVDKRNEEHPGRTANQHYGSKCDQPVKTAECSDYDSQNRYSTRDNRFCRPPGTGPRHDQSPANCARPEASEQEPIADCILIHTPGNSRQQRKECA